MTSYQITPNMRAAGRFVSRVRRAIQKALAEEETSNGIAQSDIARAIDVTRSVISREIRGYKDLTLSRVAELAWATRADIFFAKG
jgi:predicted transcriptional regulator